MLFFMMALYLRLGFAQLIILKKESDNMKKKERKKERKEQIRTEN